MVIRVNFLLVGAEGADFFFRQEFKLGDANPVFAGNHAIERARQMHDAFNRLVGRLQHVVVIRVDRNIGMHIAVTGMHVQGNENAATQHFFVNGFNTFNDRSVDAAVKNFAESGVQLLFPRDAD